MTTFTVPSGVSSEGSREQPAAARAAASRTGTRRAFIVLSRSCSLDVIVRGRSPVGSAEQVGHVHRDRAGGAAGGAGAAVPALVDVHVRLAVVGVDRQRVERADLHTQGAVLDAQLFVDRDG